jgi:hypothetical protein
MKILFVILFSTFLCLSNGKASSDLAIAPDVPELVKEKFLADLKSLRRVSGSAASSFHSIIFGPGAERVSGEAYYNFFTHRVSDIDTENSKQDFFVNAGGLKDPKKLYITNEYEKFVTSMPQIERWAVLIHEARHNESPTNWPHVLCPKTFSVNKKPIVTPWGEALAGKYACDDKALGSYGITIVMARNIELHCDNCSKELKTQAGQYARSILLRIINPQAITILKKDLYPKEI